MKALEGQFCEAGQTGALGAGPAQRIEPTLDVRLLVGRSMLLDECDPRHQEAHSNVGWVEVYVLLPTVTGDVGWVQTDLVVHTEIGWIRPTLQAEPGPFRV